MISPRFLNNGALPIGFEPQPPVPTPQTGESHGRLSRKPIRVLSRRIADQSPIAFARSPVEEPSSEKIVTSFDNDQSVRILSNRAVPHNAPLSGSVDPPGNSNRVVASSKPDRRSSPYAPEAPGGLAGRIAALAGNHSTSPYPRELPPYGTEFENDGLPQPWLFRALTGRW